MIANDPAHLGGAIDADGADKAARFMQLCDAFALPLLFLCDTPGFMVGPDAERTASVRYFARMFLTGASSHGPRRHRGAAQGLRPGGPGDCGRGLHAAAVHRRMATSEFGGMGLEGAVRLGMRRELELIEDEAERERAFEAMVALAHERAAASA